MILIWTTHAHNMEMCLWEAPVSDFSIVLGPHRSHLIHFIVQQPATSQEPPQVQAGFAWHPSCNSFLAAGQMVDKVLWEVIVLTKSAAVNPNPGPLI